MSKTNLIEDELDLLIDSVLEAAPPDLKARCVKDDILAAFKQRQDMSAADIVKDWVR